MKKVLLIATVEGFFNFEKNDIKILQELGYQVHIATNSQGVERPIDLANVVKHQISFARNPFSKKNIIAYRELCDLASKYQFELIHCHTPVGGVLGRLLGRKYHIKTIYTAHGFHFFKGAPLKNWLIFYPVEKMLASWTNTLITINKEDYLQAKEFKAANLEYIPGVGIDCEKYKFNMSKEEYVSLRTKCGLLETDIVLLSVGELSYRKNHQIILEAISKIPFSNIKYIICGSGEKEDDLRQKACELEIEDNVKLVGYQKNILEFMAIADVFVFPSLQEGLPVALMEAMACGLPIVASNIRGNVDLIEDGKNGFLVSPNSCSQYVEKVSYLIEHPEMREEMRCKNLKKIKMFDCKIVEQKMRIIYQTVLQGKNR